MTAVICIPKPDGILIYTDGATYNQEGFFLRPASKATIFLHHPSVFVARGSGRPGNAIEYNAELAPSYDEMLISLPEHLKSISKYAFEFAGDAINLAIICGGWSSSEGRWKANRIWISGNDPNHLDDGSLKLAEITKFSIEPRPGPHARRLLEDRGLLTHLSLLNHLPATIETDARIIGIVQCLRETPFGLGFGSDRPKGCIVGAFIQKTMLTRDKAYTEIIHRWPDKIGEKLGMSDAQTANDEGKSNDGEDHSL